MYKAIPFPITQRFQTFRWHCCKVWLMNDCRSLQLCIHVLSLGHPATCTRKEALDEAGYHVLSKHHFHQKMALQRHSSCWSNLGKRKRSLDQENVQASNRSVRLSFIGDRYYWTLRGAFLSCLVYSANSTACRNRKQYQCELTVVGTSLGHRSWRHFMFDIESLKKRLLKRKFYRVS